MKPDDADDDWSIFRVMKNAKRDLRAQYARPCPVCVERLPKAPPSLLLPGQKCRMHGYQDNRPRLTEEQVNAVFSKFGLKRIKYDVIRSDQRS